MKNQDKWFEKHCGPRSIDMAKVINYLLTVIVTVL